MNGIEINNLTVDFGTFKLDDISVNFRKGCITGLVGKNGAGKTTIFHNKGRRRTGRYESIYGADVGIKGIRRPLGSAEKTDGHDSGIRLYRRGEAAADLQLKRRQGEQDHRHVSGTESKGARGGVPFF